MSSRPEDVSQSSARLSGRFTRSSSPAQKSNLKNNIIYNLVLAIPFGIIATCFIVFLPDAGSKTGQWILLAVAFVLVGVSFWIDGEIKKRNINAHLNGWLFLPFALIVCFCFMPMILSHPTYCADWGWTCKPLHTAAHPAQHVRP